MSNHVRSFTLLRLFIIIVLFFIYFLFVCTASADTLSLPNSLEIIEDEAFYSDSSLDEVIVPEGTTTIKCKAFAYSGLQEISLPRSLSFIAEDAFEGCQEFSVKVPMNCYAYTWCMNHGYISAPDPTPTEDFEWQTINGLEVKITKYIGSDANVIIPEIIDDYDVAEIDKNAFKGNTTLTYVYIPGSVRTVGSHAFQNCVNLSDVGFSNGLVDIGAEAFRKCSSLAYADLPDSLEGIGEGAFRECVNLEGFHYPASLDHRNSLYDNGFLYDGNIFRDCNKLTTYTIPEGTTTVCEGLFYGANKLQNVSLPSTLKEIGSNSFRGCVSLESIVLPDGVVTIHDYAFASCTTITMLNMPNTIKTIESHAFMDCSALTSIAFSDHLLDIGAEGFANCSALTAAELPDSLVGLGEGAFSNCVNMVSIHYPLSLDHRNSLYDNGFLYDGKTFYNCQKLRSVTIPEGVTKVADGIFMGANYLREVNLPSTLTTIEANAFSGCESIRSITIPVTVTTIGNSAFEGCTALRNITLPNNIISLGAYAFKSCTALSAVTFPTGLRSLGAGVFEECTALLAANLPDSVEGLGERAFYGCKKLSSFHYPLNLDHLVSLYDNGYFYEGNVFYNCNALKTIEIPSGVSKIPSALFAGSNYLETVIVPDTVTTIGGQGLWWSNGQSFKDCVAMEKIYIGPNVTTIGDDTFAGCTNLTVWCEYGSAMLQHCIDNNVPYYYLTPDGVNNPSGTLYKGDSYGLHGYARASIPLIDVTATIWNSDRSEIVQTISINPGETDYSLSGEINANMLFGTLDLGNYHYTLTASTEMSEEQWANTSFTIVPPPLRVSVRGISSLSGVVGNDYSLSGTIYSNYPITNLAVTLTNLSTGSTSLQYSTSPNTTSYNLSNLNSRINWANLSIGYYNLSISVSGNGETKTPVNADFSIGDYDGEIDTTLYDQMISFVGNDDNFSLFNQFNDGWSFISSLDTVDMLNLSWQFKSDMVKDKIKNVLTGDDLSRFKIKQYKKEILAIIDDLDPSITLTSSSSTYNKFIQSMVSNNRIMFTQDPDDPFVSYYMMNMSKVLNFQFDKIDKLCDINSWIMNAKDYYSEIIQNYENSLRILEVYSGYDGISNPEMKKAVEEIAEDYSSKVLKSLHKLNDKILEQLAKYTYKEAIKMFGTSVGQLYKIVTFAVDAALEFNGYDKVADAMMDVIIRVDIYGQALSSYRQAFNTVKNGDTSSAALNRLGMSYQVCCTSCYRMYEALATTAWYEREFNENSRLMEIYSELRRMSYREPFVHWRTGQ